MKIKPNAPSCERNQQVILDVLKDIIKPTNKHLLEIGSGTGQHAVFMAPHFPKVQWHTSDLPDNHAGINMWLDEAKLGNVSAPINYQAGKTQFPDIDVDVVFTTNTLHIMSWENVQQLIVQWGEHLKSGSQIVIYGPFNYNGQFTSKSNAQFDLWLRDRNTFSGIREFETIVRLMTKVGISLVMDIEMPANNRMLVFNKTQIPIENTMITQVLDAPRKPIKSLIINEVTTVFLDFLYTSVTCIIKRISLSGFG